MATYNARHLNQFGFNRIEGAAIRGYWYILHCTRSNAAIKNVFRYIICNFICSIRSNLLFYVAHDVCEMIFFLFGSANTVSTWFSATRISLYTSVHNIYIWQLWIQKKAIDRVCIGSNCSDRHHMGFYVIISHISTSQRRATFQICFYIVGTCRSFYRSNQTPCENQYNRWPILNREQREKGAKRIVRAVGPNVFDSNSWTTALKMEPALKIMQSYGLQPVQILWLNQPQT